MKPETRKKIAIWNARNVYLLGSGILFVVLGCFIFVRGKGYINILWNGLLGLIFFLYGIYRLLMFRRYYKEAIKDNQT